MDKQQLAQSAAQAVDADELVRLTQALVRIASYYPGPGEQPVVDFLEAYLRGRGFKTTVQAVAPGRPNLIADLGQGAGGLILEGHTDVVTHGSLDQWTIPPYEARIVDGKIYGRGACDMKGGLAAAICAAVAVQKVLGTPQKTLRLCLPCDEEGLMIGIKAFIRAGYAEGFAGAIVCEPEENQVCLWQKGAMRVWVHFQGKMAHGAMPYAGANPIPSASRFVLELGRLQAALQAESRHEYLGLPWITPTVFQAGAGEGQFNVMPDRVRVGLDIRTNPGQDHRVLEARLRRALDESLEAGISARLEVFEDRPATETPREAALVQAVEQGLRLLQMPIRYGGVPGATDGTFLRAWAGLPIVTLGPGGKTTPHQADEYIQIEEMLAAARLYAAVGVLMLAE
ncbi:M20 family metallopeptidase [Meiothermus taiwanensis]|jgi:succinyl-diaminopimelate desuccinylase|uniref:Probable succinyl-diaminopimelate desuccinylase n=2 Tax=Meiothermus taiwanensis TaxID=172827 RepID=A0A399DRI8_9DEIN|nr:M20 family metallopeptidase [Meiothermus taiwanensis]AWR85552.1 acetylornithine deacetylase or succinyl-diaminopimelate desuccinylase [Meiothermus taiwanensis WR-220]KIQ54021.1 peptidase M20 [Meiothermus taiwanensis]KZK16391.1 peptidase M20 [Meiothermus taiwanensis]RIH74607.1 putative succinyl-diaminopimelate desuccinylase [Meiothermus taiwanensis]